MEELTTEPSGQNVGRTALELLVVDNHDLDELEALLGQFNVFEAIGAVRHELRHSDFLAFLLNPRQNHGLGDEFARRLLQKVLISAGDQPLPITPIDLDVWDLNELIVLREWQNIDILLLEETLKVSVIIENKIDSVEHSNQLARYFQAVAQHYRGWKILGVYLTKEGDIPSHRAYLPIDYTAVCEIIERITAKRASTLGDDVRTLMTHYTQMLRRHIVSDSEIAELCRRIYRKHQKALDLILEHRPDQQAEIRVLLENIVQETPGLLLDHCSKGYVRFAAELWNNIPQLRLGSGWTSSGRMLLFEFENLTGVLTLRLHIGPGPDETRQTLFDMARTHQPPLKAASKTLNQKWNSIYSKPFLKPKDYDDADDEQLEKKIQKHWAEFVGGDLPKIIDIVKEEKWV
jgi:DNA-directed RNA polymerase subunit F